MSFLDHIEAMRKEMNHMNSQIQQHKLEIEKAKSEINQQKSQVQAFTDSSHQTQAEIVKNGEMAKRLEALARSLLPYVEDPTSQMQLAQELENIQKATAMQSMQMAAAAAAAMPMMMRPPVMGAMETPRSKANGANMMATMGAMQQSPMQQMQQFAFAQQQMQMMAAQAGIMGFPIQQMMSMGAMPGLAGMPMPQMMIPNPAMMQQHFSQMQQHQPTATSVSTPSRNQSTSGAVSRTRTPLTASTTSSPRPAEPAKEDISMLQQQQQQPAAGVVSTTSSQSPPQQVTTTTNTNDENAVAVA